MSANLSSYISCPAIQNVLNGDKFVNFDPTTQRAVPNLTRVLASPLNTQGVLQNQIAPGGGRTRTVQVTYSPRLLTSATSDSPIDGCTTTDNYGELDYNYEIDSQVGTWYSESISLDDLEENCKSDGYWVTSRVNAMIDVVVRRINEKNATELATLFGNHATTLSDAAVEGATLASDGQWVTDLVGKINREKRKEQVMGNMFAFGSGAAFGEWQDIQGFNCCTGAANVDMNGYNAAYGPALVYDGAIEDAGGFNGDDDIFALMAPGAVQMLQYNKYDRGERGIRVIDTETEKRGVIFDPLSGLQFDYVAKYDCDVWTFVVGTAHQLVAMPPDMFCAGDPLEGVNYLTQWKIVNP